ncbi:MAG: hypothetical protein LBP32_00200 [Spirochaetaceae bacterium]|nr:hypothetical protein [Spirochaetaceae bacterium]
MAKILNFEDFSGKRDEAQEIVWDAWEVEDPVKRVALVKKALEIDPDCTDAYNILGYEEKDPEKRLGYFMRAAESFKKRHDQNYFDEMTGYFWGEMETRPFMRALMGCGQSLWDSGKRKEAVETFTYILTLNPSDNQGVRYFLISWLLIIDEVKGARKLLKTYTEGTAAMRFSMLLVTILEKKDKTLIRKRYEAAVETNGYIVPYLLKKKRIPAKIPDNYTWGSKEEAVVYVKDEYGAAAWAAHPEALTVLSDLDSAH